MPLDYFLQIFKCNLRLLHSLPPRKHTLFGIEGYADFEQLSLIGCEGQNIALVLDMFMASDSQGNRT